MKPSKMKVQALSAAVLIAAMTVTACSGAGEKAGPASTSPAAAESATPSSSPAASASASSPISVSEAQSGEGEFVGMIDGHSVEIKMDDVPTAFQIDEGTADQVSVWEEGTAVKFQYVVATQEINGEQVKQFSITAIEKA